MMGLNLFISVGDDTSCKECDCDCRESDKKLPNPDPNNYVIGNSMTMGDYLVVIINYPDCKNYEGNKILVYKGITLRQLEREDVLDPHFTKNPQWFSPIARFEPTNEGWQLACKLVTTLDKDKDNV